MFQVKLAIKTFECTVENMHRNIFNIFILKIIDSNIVTVTVYCAQVLLPALRFLTLSEIKVVFTIIF